MLVCPFSGHGPRLDGAAEMTYTTNGLVPATIMDFQEFSGIDSRGTITESSRRKQSMERAEYDLMAAVEDRMWWFRGLHALATGAWLRARRGFPKSRSILALDAGCGTGGLLRQLAMATPDTSFVGLDFAQSAAAVARDKSNQAVTAASVDALPFSDGTFSAMFSMDVLCHRGVDEAQALSEAYRCLASGGVFIVNLPAYRWMLSSHDERVHNTRRYNHAEVIAMLKRAGFRSIVATYWNTFLFPLMVLKRKIIGGEESDVRPFPAPLEYLFRFVLACERMLLRTGLRLPFGGSIFAVAVKG
jgi:SAM-dependent methyltransferase